ncbi:DHA2 family efflux MFS transporter permease subunit [Novosphingobium sp. FSY-8]|uniref:DHA2 family efflux MFS transporter permease subunit n=1 Tax=Novosphingobium ovatum TaxID=1908523 RepID=A0ABW9XDW4_9SPHN|nr:DHA2 family efflux MFS transporter permease subunit [Novosphingobium ovatum]
MALALGSFMQVLDSTIANVALPTIAGNLGESNETGTWVITAFAAANGITVPLTGWLMRRFGVVTTFTASVALFTLASFLCGIAWSMPSLVAFRLIQGAVSGPMIPGSQALLLAVFPPQKRALAMSIWSMTALIGPVLGPIMGGYISDHIHWGWIFLINVPVGIFTVMALLSKLLPYNTRPQKLPIDMVGMTLLAVWVGSLQVVLDLGKNADWFHSTLICGLTAAAAVAFVAWIIWELTDEHPAVDLSLFKRRNFAIATLGFCLGYAFFFANNLLMPLWLQQQQGYTATWAGMVAAPAGVVAFFLAPVVARLSGKMDIRILATLSLGAFTTAYFMRTYFSADTDLWHYVVPSLVQGSAMGMFFMSMTTIALDGLPPHRIPSATGISNFARITGGAFAASIVTTAWDRREALHQSRLADWATNANPAYAHATHTLQATGMSPQQVHGAMVHDLINQSYLLASIDMFWISGVCSAVMLGMVWLCRRPALPQGGPPVAAD